MIFKIGRCNQCGECCKWRFVMIYADDKDDIKFYQYHKGIEIREFDSTLVVAAIPFKCNFLKKEGKKYVCHVHEKNIQPRLCRDWPFGDYQMYYQAVNKLQQCGYKFEDIDVEAPQPLG